MEHMFEIPDYESCKRLFNFKPTLFLCVRQNSTGRFGASLINCEREPLVEIDEFAYCDWPKIRENLIRSIRGATVLCQHIKLTGQIIGELDAACMLTKPVKFYKSWNDLLGLFEICFPSDSIPRQYEIDQCLLNVIDQVGAIGKASASNNTASAWSNSLNRLHSALRYLVPKMKSVVGHRKEMRLLEEKEKLEARGIKFIERLKIIGITALYHITHVSNLPSIFQNGLLPRELATPFNFRDISNLSVQEKRTAIHHMTPLYFNSVGPMLSKIREIQDEIVHLELETMVLATGHFKVWDRHFLARNAREIQHPNELSRIDWALIRAKYWTDRSDAPELAQEKRHKRQAEILIESGISSSYFRRIIASNEYVASMARQVCRTSEEVVVDRSYYF